MRRWMKRWRRREPSPDRVGELLVEAGPALAGAFLAADLVDELVLYQALSLLGPQAAPLASLPRLESLSRRLTFRLLDSRQVGAVPG